ncbi:MAG: hypothetical protein JWM27_1614 [Gemmatimonadetes bacterium]|nr:hypothetical protein [Gemmatimonadota bacterium]
MTDTAFDEGWRARASDGARAARTFWAAGCVLACLAVAAGAFGAHALRARLAPDLLAVFETAARYQMYHALALLAASYAAARRGGTAAGWLFIGGTVLFSGSLYLLAVTGVRWLGAVTPLGGVAFLAGWLALARAGWRGGTGGAA